MQTIVLLKVLKSNYFLLSFHGWARAGSSSYRHLIPLLVASGHRVAVMDLRGHGDSDTTFSDYDDEALASAPDPADEQDLRASTAATDMMFKALAGYRLGDYATVDATRMLRATLQGFITIEAAGGFGMARPVDESFNAAIAALTASLSNFPRYSQGRS